MKVYNDHASVYICMPCRLLLLLLLLYLGAAASSSMA
jgi:hypothetical protein